MKKYTNLKIEESVVDLSKSINPESKKVKVKRLCWMLIWGLISFLPKYFSFLKVFMINLFGGKVSKGILILPNVRIDMPWNLEIKENVALGQNVWLYNFAKIYIGANSVISQNTTLCTATHDYTHPHMLLKSYPITIEDQVWVSSNCFILPNITIETGVVVGACSLVTKSLPKWFVCAGNPCKPLKKREINNVT